MLMISSSCRVAPIFCQRIHRICRSFSAGLPSISRV
jgi:hypothetical protein